MNKEDIKKYTKFLAGEVVASAGISCVIASGLGAFPVTCCNLAITNMLGVSYGVANVIVESGMIGYSLYRKEGLGVGTIMNSVLGGFMVDWLLLITPKTPLVIVGLVLLPVGWAMMGKCGIGEPASNILMRALMKQTKKGVGLIRTLEEIGFMLVGLLGGVNITWFTILLSLCFGMVTSKVYNLLKFKPTEVEHRNLW